MFSPIINPQEVNTVRIEHQSEQTIYHYTQEVSGILNDNERERIDGTYDGRSEFRKAASVPMVLWLDWEKKGITADQRELRKAIERHGLEVKTTNKKLI